MLKGVSFSRVSSLVATAFFFGVIFLISKNIPQETIHAYLKDSGSSAPLVFMLFMLLTYIFAPISASPILLVGFYLFGPFVVFWTAIAAFVAVITNFWIARKLGRKLVLKIIGKDNMTRVDQFTQRYGFITLLFLRLFNGGTHDLISYAAGLTTLPFIPYFGISIIGMIPGQFIWYFIAKEVSSPLHFTVLSIALAAFSSLLFFIGIAVLNLRKRKAR